jgi:hypothetical protein
MLVNATGLAAATLASDEAVVPVRGQTVKVLAPFITTFRVIIDGSVSTHCCPHTVAN